MILWVIIITTAMLALTFGLNVRGLTGAIMMGITVLTIDHYCLWLRFLLHRNGINNKVKETTIIGGFFFRIINVVFFLLIGAKWLVPNSQPVFHWILISIPVWNLLGAIKLANCFNTERR